MERPAYIKKADSGNPDGRRKKLLLPAFNHQTYGPALMALGFGQSLTALRPTVAVQAVGPRLAHHLSVLFEFSQQAF
jgi:hypothetical protein